ncbi:MAG: transglycosylase domain-containing protein [Firmicutes bacterium]|nr:transglycosylase domain-containing protein [Bacillota bacterium]
MESTKKAAPGHNKTGSGKSTQNKQKKPKKSLGNILKVLLIGGIILSIIGAAVVYLYIMVALKDIEPIDPDQIAAALTENSVIVDAEGRVLEQIHSDGLRTVIKYDDMSQDLINAFVAVEDKTFFEHNGFNFIRLFGAVKDTLTTGKRLGGTSTITQQLARNIYLYEIKSVRALDRKVKEAYYAIELEKYLSKELIIEGYLNLVYLGANSNGVEAAAQAYFSKSASEVNYIEAALLAGIVKSPSLYPPMINKQKIDVTEEDYVFDDSDPLYTLVYNPNCEDRYLTAIYLMHENGKITDAEYEYAKTVDLKTVINPGKSAQSEISSFFADMVKDEVVADLVEQYGYTASEAKNLLYTGGLTIESTIDFDMQKTLESHYAQNNFTPYYGESTAVAVRAFQKDNGLTADGVAGQMTLGKIRELTGMDTSTFTQEVYKKGSNNEEVILLKRTLFELGYLINNENFPKVTVMLDKEGNIISEESKRLLVYKQSNLIDADKNFVIPSSDYSFDAEGNLILLKNKRMYFYPHYQDDQLVSIQVVVRETFTYDENSDENEKLAGGKYNLNELYTYEGRDVLIPNEYKTFDDDGNVVVDKAFMVDYPDFFTVDGNQNLLVSKGDYVISDQGVIQPQSAMVIIDYHNGELKSIVGGRNIVGQRVYNRATNPRQPGSAIKPLSVFTPAIDSGRYTAATVTDDRPVYLLGDKTTRWPLNWYESYNTYAKHWGLVTLRESVQWSINVTAALIAQDLGVQTSLDYLKKFGISTLVTEGPVNDANIAAVALGGMTKGITPIDLTAAYGAIANKGVLNDVITYKTVKNGKGEIILQNESKQTYVVDENVAYIVQDMMKTSVESGVATPAKLSPKNDVMPVTGKTGTTSSNIDAWFIGYTGYYVGGVWFGNDYNFPLDQGSRIAAQFWKTVMSDIHVDLESRAFDVPKNITTVTVDIISGKLPSELSALDPRGTVRSEIFLKGTEPTETDDVHVMADVCTESGKLATPYCPTTLVQSKLFVKRPVPYIPAEHKDIFIKDMIYDLPVDQCDLHNETNVTTESPTSSTTTDFIGVQPTVKLLDGTLFIQRPYPIELTSGQTIILPVGTRIKTDNSILFADGSTIPASDIKNIPNYTAEELDALNP